MEQVSSTRNETKMKQDGGVARSCSAQELDDIGVGSAEDYDLFMGANWNAAKCLFKRRKCDFTAATKALEEANKSLNIINRDV